MRHVLSPLRAAATAVIVTLACAASLVAAPARATDIQTVTSPRGITAWLVEAPEIPILSLEIAIIGGTVIDPPGKEGVTRMMMALLEDGAGDLDAIAFSGAAQDLGAGFGFDAGRDSVSISASMLSENRDASTDLLALALQEPRFDVDAVERIRDQLLSSIRSDSADPGRIAGRAFAQAAFPGHVYARQGTGTAQTVAALTVEDLRAAHRATLVRDRLVVGVVGDITAAELGPMLDRLLGWMPRGGAPLPPVATPVDGAETIVIPFQSPQTVARFGHSGIARDDPDFIAAFVAMEILGGAGYGSRLTEEVREKRGLTYGVSASLASNRFGPLVFGGLNSANETMAEALEVIRAEWARMATDGVTQEELDNAKRYLTGAYALRFDGNARIAGILVGLQLAGLDPGYVDRRNNLVSALTLEEVNATAARIFMPDKLRVVVVGAPDGMTPTQ